MSQCIYRYDLYVIVTLYIYLRQKTYICILCIYAYATNTQLMNDMQYLYVIKHIHVYSLNILANIYIYACILIPHMTWCLYSYIFYRKKTHEKGWNHKRNRVPSTTPPGTEARMDILLSGSSPPRKKTMAF